MIRNTLLGILALLLASPALPAPVEPFVLNAEVEDLPSLVKDGVRITLESLVEQETRRGYAVVAELTLTNETDHEILALVVRDADLTLLQVRGEAEPRGVRVKGFPDCGTQLRATANCMRDRAPEAYLRLSPGVPYSLTLASGDRYAAARSGIANIALRVIFRDGARGEPRFQDFAFTGERLRAQDRELAVYRKGLIYSIGRVKAAVLKAGQQRGSGEQAEEYVYYFEFGLVNGARADAEVVVAVGTDESYVLPGDPQRLPMPLPVKATGIRACDAQERPAVPCRRGSPLFSGQRKTFYVQTREEAHVPTSGDSASLRLRLGVRFNIRPDEDFTWVELEYDSLPLGQEAWGRIEGR